MCSLSLLAWVLVALGKASGHLPFEYRTARRSFETYGVSNEFVDYRHRLDSSTTFDGDVLRR